jgi:hypothetical protein
MKIKIIILKINENFNHFTNNVYDHGLPMFGN